MENTQLKRYLEDSREMRMLFDVIHEFITPSFYSRNGFYCFLLISSVKLQSSRSKNEKGKPNFLYE